MRLSDISSRLTAGQCDAINPIFLIDEQKIDAMSHMFENDEIIGFKFLSTQEARCCPFELHFGKHCNQLRLSVFLGKAAGFYNFEDVSTPELRKQSSEDLDLLLTSEIEYLTCRLLFRREQFQEVFHLSNLQIAGKPLDITYSSSNWFIFPFLGTHKAKVTFAPWVSTT